MKEIVLFFVVCAAVLGLQGCRGFSDPVVDGERAFVKGVQHDVDLFRADLEVLKKKVENKVDKDIVDELKKLACLCDKSQFCKCDRTKECHCSDNGGHHPDSAPAWYRSSTDTNVCYYGVVKFENGEPVLYYTFIYYISQNVVVPAPKMGINGSSPFVKSFSIKPVEGPKTP